MAETKRQDAVNNLLDKKVESDIKKNVGYNTLGKDYDTLVKKIQEHQKNVNSGAYVSPEAFSTLEKEIADMKKRMSAYGNWIISNTPNSKEGSSAFGAVDNLTQMSNALKGQSSLYADYDENSWKDYQENKEKYQAEYEKNQAEYEKNQALIQEALAYDDKAGQTNVNNLKKEWETKSANLEARLEEAYYKREYATTHEERAYWEKRYDELNNEVSSAKTAYETAKANHDNLVEAKNKYARMQKYANLSNAQDWAEKSATTNTKWYDYSKSGLAADAINNKGEDDLLDVYDAILNNRGAIAGVTSITAPLVSAVLPFLSTQGRDARDRYEHMTDEQKQIFNYLYNTEGGDSAMQYLSDINDELVAKETKEEKAKVDKFVGNLAGWVPGKWAEEFAEVPVYAVTGFKSGVEESLPNLYSGLFNKEKPIANSEYLIQALSEDSNPASKALLEVGQSIGNMTPSIVLGTALQAIGVPTGLASAIGATEMGFQARGSAYSDAIRQGYSKEKASLYATANGALEATLQYALGGIDGVSSNALSKGLTAAMPGMVNAIAKIQTGWLRVLASGAFSVAKNMGSEAIEEGLQAFLDPYVRQLILEDGDLSKVDVNWEEIGYSALLGALTSGIMGPMEVISDIQLPEVTAEYISKQYDTSKGEDRYAVILENLSAETSALLKQATDAVSQGKTKEAQKLVSYAKNLTTYTQRYIEREGGNGATLNGTSKQYDSLNARIKDNTFNSEAAATVLRENADIWKAVAEQTDNVAHTLLNDSLTNKTIEDTILKDKSLYGTFKTLTGVDLNQYKTLSEKRNAVKLAAEAYKTFSESDAAKTAQAYMEANTTEKNGANRTENRIKAMSVLNDEVSKLKAEATELRNTKPDGYKAKVQKLDSLTRIIINTVTNIRNHNNMALASLDGSVVINNTSKATKEKSANKVAENTEKAKSVTPTQNDLQTAWENLSDEIRDMYDLVGEEGKAVNGETKILTEEDVNELAREAIGRAIANKKEQITNLSKEIVKTKSASEREALINERGEAKQELKALEAERDALEEYIGIKALADKENMESVRGISETIIQERITKLNKYLGKYGVDIAYEIGGTWYVDTEGNLLSEDEATEAIKKGKSVFKRTNNGEASDWTVKIMSALAEGSVPVFTNGRLLYLKVGKQISAEQAVDIIIGHELVHFVKNNASKQSQDLYKRIINNIKGTSYDVYEIGNRMAGLDVSEEADRRWNNLKNLYADAIVNNSDGKISKAKAMSMVDEDYIYEEIAANYMGSLMASEGVINTITETLPTMQKIMMAFSSKKKKDGLKREAARVDKLANALLEASNRVHGREQDLTLKRAEMRLGKANETVERTTQKVQEAEERLKTAEEELKKNNTAYYREKVEKAKENLLKAQENEALAKEEAQKAKTKAENAKKILSAETKTTGAENRGSRMMVYGNNAQDESYYGPERRWKGPDDKDRFEVSDKDMVFDINGLVPDPEYLTDFIKHDVLFWNYPKLANEWKLKFVDIIGGSETTYGKIDDENKTIIIKKGLNKTLTRKAILHELQHVVQRIEGFVEGANPQIAGAFLFNKVYDSVKNSPNFKAINDINDKINFVVAEVEKEYGKSFIDLANDAYENFYGEIEARQTADRGRWQEKSLVKKKRVNEGGSFDKSAEKQKLIDNFIEMGYPKDEAKTIALKLAAKGFDTYDESNQRANEAKSVYSRGTWNADGTEGGDRGFGSKNDRRDNKTQRSIHGQGTVRGVYRGTTEGSRLSDRGLVHDVLTANVKHSFSSIAYNFFEDPDMSTEEFIAKDYKETKGYKEYVEKCLNNYRQTRPNFNEKKARKSIEDSIDGIVRVAIAAKNAGYDIYDDPRRKDARDSKNRPLFSSLEPNSDYFTSNDISTECDKRKNFQEIYEAIVKKEEEMNVPKGKRFFDNVDNYFYIHKVLAEKGLTQPCRECYVESMRKNLAPMANAFVELVGEEDGNNTSNKQLYNKGELKVNNAELRENVREVLAQYGVSANFLTVEMLSTEDGLATLKLTKPEIYEAFNSFYGQSKPKLPRSSTPFRFGDLTALLIDNKGNIKQSLVNKINATGGFRLQSYSDFQIENYVDVLQVLFEAGTLGLAGHAYTKVPAFLEATEGTNLKRNISIFMYKDGSEWRLDRNDSFPGTLEGIYDIVDDDKSGNTGIIAVSQNDDMSAWIMANDHIGYGIPFHKSGLKMATVRDTDVKTEDRRVVKGYKGTKDHTKQQTEVWAKTTEDHKALTKVKKGISIYQLDQWGARKWDFENKSNLPQKKLIEKNVKAYIDACENAGYIPRFRDYVKNNQDVLKAVLKYSKEFGVVSQDATIEDISFKYKGYTIPYGYYKFLGDFEMFTPDGKAAPQEILSLDNYDFDKAVDFFKDAEALKRNEILQQFANGEEREAMRESNLTAEQLQKIVKQKRGEIADEIVTRGKRKSDSKMSVTPEESVNDFVNSMRDIQLKNGFPTREDVYSYVEAHPKLNFIERMVNRDETVEQDLEDFLSNVDEVDMLQSLSSFMEAYYKKELSVEDIESGKRSYRGSVRSFTSTVRDRISEIVGERDDMRSLKVKESEVTLNEVKSLFNSINGNNEIKPLADKVFATAEKLGVNIRFTNQPFDPYAEGDNYGDMVEYNTAFFNSDRYTDQQKATTVLHELIHVCTSYYVNNNPESEAVKKLNKIYEQIKTDSAFKGQYGLTSVKEMVAELSNPKFNALLKAKNLWQEIVDAIAKLFGYTRGTTAYDNAMQILDGILDSTDVATYKDYALTLREGTKKNLGRDAFGKTEYTDENGNAAVKYSVTPEEDEAYMEAYFDGDDERMQELVDQAAYKSGYRYKAYHHTENAFTIFDLDKARKSMDIQGFYFSADPDAESEYGSVRYDTYLKMDNPYIVDSKESQNAIPFDMSKGNAGVDARNWLKAHGYDGVIRKAEYFGAEADEYIVLDPEQIKSAEPMTFEDDEYGEGDIIPLSERFNKYSDDIRFSATEETDFEEVDFYSERQYNDFGWARHQGVLTVNELDDLYSKLNEKKSLKGFVSDGYGGAVVEVNDKPYTTLGVDNVLLFITGTKSSPKINKVVRFFAITEEEMETIRSVLYENGKVNYTNFAYLVEQEVAKEYKRRGAVGYNEYKNEIRSESIRRGSRATDQHDKQLDVRDGIPDTDVGGLQEISQNKGQVKHSVTPEESAENVLKKLKTTAMGAKYLTNYATYTDERINREIQNSSANGIPDYAKSYITWVDPIDFIYATTTSEEYRNTLKEEAGKLDLDRLKKETQPIHLTVNFETGDIVGHEGRHRMLALRDKGISKVAVIIDAINDDRHHTKPIEFMSLNGQKFPNGRHGTDMFLHDMLPLSERYAEDARRFFSTEAASKIRFSVTEEVIGGENYAALAESLEKNKATTEKLINAMIKNGKGEYDVKSIPQFIRDVRRAYGSKDSNGVNNAYSDAYQYVYNKKLRTEKDGKSVWEKVDKVDPETARELFRNVAKVIFDSSVEDDRMSLLREIRNIKISVPNEVKATFENWNKFRTSNFGKLSLTKDGVTIGEAYAKLNEIAPELFPDSITDPVEQLNTISDEATNLRNEIESEEYTTAEKDTIEAITAELIGGTMALDPSAKHLYETLAETRQYYRERIENIKASKDAWWQDMMNEKLRSKDERYRLHYEKGINQKLLKDITKRLYKPTTDKHIPESMRGDIAYILGGLKLPDKPKAYKELKTIIKNVVANGEFDQATFDKFPEGFEKTVNEAHQVDFENMDSVTAHELNQFLRSVMHYIKLEDSLFHSSESASYAAAMATEQINLSTKENKIVNGFVQKAEELWMSAYDAEGLFNYVGIDELYRAYREIAKGQDTFASSVSKYADLMSKVLKENGLEDGVPKEWHTQKLEFNLDGSKKPLLLTQAELMSLYLLEKQEDSKNRLLNIGGGIETLKQGEKEVEETVNGKTKKVTRKGYVVADSFKLTEHDLYNKILPKLDPTAKDVADGISKILNGEIANDLNKTSLVVDGYKKFNVKNYFPESVSDTVKKVGLLDKEIEALMTGKSFTKDRTGSKGVPLKINDIFEVYDRHILGASQYIGYEKALRDFNKVYNGTYNGKRLSNAIQNKMGVKTTNAIENFIRSVQGRQMTTRDDQQLPLEKMFGNYKAAKVALNASVVMKQPTALLRAVPEFSGKGTDVIARVGKETLKTMGDVVSFKRGWDRRQAIIDEMVEHSGLARMKSWGFSEYATAKTVGQLYDRNSLTWRDKMNELPGFNLAEMADLYTWSIIWEACKAETKTLEEATDKFNDVIRKTQVVESATTSSPIAKSNFYTKIVFAFKNEPLKTLNYIRACLKDAVRGKDGAGNHLAKAVTWTGLSIALTSAITTAFSLGRDDEDDDIIGNKDWWKVISDEYKENFWSDVLGTSTVFLGDIVPAVESALRGREVERADTALVTDTVNLLMRLYKGNYAAPLFGGDDPKRTGLSFLYDASDVVSTITGLPIRTVMRDTKAFAKNVLAVFDGPKADYKYDKLFYTVEGNKARYKKMLTEALDNGFDEYIELKEELLKNGFSKSDVESAIKNSDRFVDAWNSGSTEFNKLLNEAQKYDDRFTSKYVIGLMESKRNDMVSEYIDAILKGENTDEIKEGILAFRSPDTKRLTTEKELDKLVSEEIESDIKRELKNIEQKPGTPAYEKKLEKILKKYDAFDFVTADYVRKLAKKVSK